MTSDQLPQVCDIPDSQQRHEVPALSRRALLKRAAVAGGISVSGAATGGIVSAAESTERTDTAEDTPEVLESSSGATFAKTLIVEGAETGINYYQFSISDAISPEEVVTAEVRDNTAPLVTGKVQNQDTKVYYFNGKVTDVSARGSITYSIHE